MPRKIIFRIIIVIVVVIAAYRMYLNQPDYTLMHVTGQTMGTIQYNVKYLGDDVPNYKKEIDSILMTFNQSLSTYIPDSEISQLNTTGKLSNPSPMFIDVMNRSQEVYLTTDGAFDPTVGPLVNAWGFGPDKRPNIPDSLTVASLLKNVGFTKINFDREMIAMDTSMYLDFSAIAKGYAVDLVAEFLELKGFEHYMVEIGGEVRTHGQNEKNEIWTIGIEDPLVSRDQQELLATIRLNNRSMATSGNYRNYYSLNGRTIAHTIDPRSGYNTKHHLLSASVFSNDCISADAFATAFMVLGLQASIEVTKSSDLEAFLIFQDSSGQLNSYISEGLKSAIGLNNTLDGSF